MSPDPIEYTVSEIYKRVGISFLDIVTSSPRMVEVLTTSERAARSDITVLLLGENGTGKNLLAQAIHNASPRREKAFVAVNCAALTEGLVESELFGHERGAYTGADRERRGRFELADGGTLFLDEIAELSAAVQAKILTAVEYRQFERVGGEKTIHADVRIVAATNRRVADLLSTGKFREDLFYRLNQVTIEIPPLRDRREDIPLLGARFLQEAARKFGRPVAGIEEEALRVLLSHPWPGNVRELKGVIRRGVAVAAGESLTLADLGLAGNARSVEDEADDLTLNGVERAHISRVLRMTGGNKKRASEVLGIARSTLDRKLDEYAAKPGGASS